MSLLSQFYGNINLNSSIESANVLSIYEFRSRFTMEEKEAIYAAAINDLKIKIFLDDLISASNVDLTNENLQNAMQYMVNNSIITQQRKEDILNVNF